MRLFAQLSVIRHLIASEGEAKVFLGQLELVFFSRVALQTWWSWPMDGPTLP